MTSRASSAVLIVDDDAAMRAYVRRCLAPLFARCLEAADGADALRILEGEPAGAVALVVSDVLMPGLDGLGLRAAVGALEGHAAVPVLLVSGEVELDPVAQAPVLRKPFNARSLRGSVAALIGRPEEV